MVLLAVFFFGFYSRILLGCATATSSSLLLRSAFLMEDSTFVEEVDAVDIDDEIVDDERCVPAHQYSRRGSPAAMGVTLWSPTLGVACPAGR